MRTDILDFAWLIVSEYGGEVSEDRRKTVGERIVKAKFDLSTCAAMAAEEIRNQALAVNQTVDVEYSPGDYTIVVVG